MKRFGLIKRGIAKLMCFAAPQAEAIETFGAGAVATQLDDGLIGPNLCWRYSDPSRRQGFWDACP